ncbi:MAG TPA: hypothetical protein PKH81_00790, partial [Treponemataceae bacterium]|nr:hypothetical protein [Treponemataceae bacterium]
MTKLSRMFFIKSAFAACLLVCLASCTKPNKVTLSGSLPPVPLTGYQASKTPTDPKALPAVKKELAFLASLSNDKREGVISGQNVGHGDQILNPSGFFGYEPLVAELERQTGEVPGMIGLDF